MLFNSLLLASLGGTILAGAKQAHKKIFAVQGGVPYGVQESYDAGLFSPVESLGALKETEFTVLGHPAFPKYSVRAKKSKFCDETVSGYTGYIDIEARHLFFYFFESRNDPDKDDVVFWTNGGPGGSSAMGLFMELGPCRVLDEKGPTFHPESWNSNANVFFVDQPVGVGFSYADYGESVSTTEDAAQDIAAFVAIFFENFSKFKGRGFHFSGESYGGRYLPVFAAAVYDQNSRLIEQGMTPINLTSVIIGNGMTDFYSMIPAYVEFQCTQASVAPIQSINTCINMRKMLPRCQKWFKAACIDHFDAIECNAAASLCQDAISVPYMNSGKNPYDISKDCEGVREETHCYPATIYIQSYLSRPDVRGLLGVDPSVRPNFTISNPEVHAAFGLTLDMLYPTVEHVAALLERGIRVLIYVGSYDWICNWVGNERWTLAMEWSGKEEFSKQALANWTVGGTFAGKTRSAKGLTFATVHGAGHMVPYDKPKESLEMLSGVSGDTPIACWEAFSKWKHALCLCYFATPIVYIVTQFGEVFEGELVSTTEEAAQDIAAFVSIFFENFSKFKGRGFHFSGESYAGRYLPVFAAAVYDQNAKLIEQGMTPINLSSVMIGNGMTDFFSMIPAYVDFQCTQASVPPIQSIETCISMRKMLPRCQRWFKAACIDHFDGIECSAAAKLCEDAISVPLMNTGKNPYDISQDCEGELEETFCYPASRHVQSYLSRPQVQDVLGVDPSVRQNFTLVNMDLNSAFGLALDMLYPTVEHVAALLERDVRVLIYVGSYDWICNWVGNERWTLAMEWSGKEEFTKQALTNWTVDGTFAGKTRSAKGLTFATVHGAGHMVPYDKPKESLEMVKRWLSGQKL